MNKNYDAEIEQHDNSVSDEDMALINSFSRRELKKEEIYTFSVILCDNEIDRDFEQFTVDSLEKLAKLFVGKTAIKNHSMNCEDQSARTYKTEVISAPERKNSLGEDYVYLKAYCYMPRLEKNASLIAEIDAGIKKEVSIGCSVAGSICSICGSDLRNTACQHRKGRKYKGKLCYSQLVNPTDAYEWSFVAVPAQKNAGVTKSFETGEVKNMNDIIKSISLAEGEVVLSKEEALELSKHINELEKTASDGEQFRKSLEDEAVKLLANEMPSFSDEHTRKICSSIETDELKAFCEALKAKKKAVAVPQLFRDKTEKKDNDTNSQFRF